MTTNIIQWLCRLLRASENCPEVIELRNGLENCQRDLANCSENYNKLLTDYNNLQKAYQDLQKKFNEEVQYYESRIQSLLSALANSISIPKITIDETPVEIGYGYVRDLIRQKLGNYVDIDIADASYWTFSKKQIEKILKPINDLIRAEWTQEIFDCDDFALFMAGLTAYTLYKNGFRRQLAFGIAWSFLHAFNFFIDKDGEIWIWEPQSGKVVGNAVNYKGDAIYGIQQIWLMG